MLRLAISADRRHFSVDELIALFRRTSREGPWNQFIERDEAGAVCAPNRPIRAGSCGKPPPRLR
jgi:hypothetical protein